MAAAGNLATTRDQRFARLFVTKPSAGPARYLLTARARWWMEPLPLAAAQERKARRRLDCPTRNEVERAQRIFVAQD